MSGLRWNDWLCLPDAALAGDRRIAKTVLTHQALLTKTEQKVLARVASLTHFATVQNSTTRIPPTQDADHDIQSVVFLRCELAGSSAYAEVAALLHKCFPNPTVILLDGEGRVCVSVAVTRRSLAERGATVIDRVESTGAFDPGDETYGGFLRAISFDALPQGDLLSYLERASSTPWPFPGPWPRSASTPHAPRGAASASWPSWPRRMHSAPALPTCAGSAATRTSRSTTALICAWRSSAWSGTPLT